MLERRTLQQLHGNKCLAFLLPNVMKWRRHWDGSERGGSLGLRLKSRERLCLICDFVRQELQSRRSAAAGLFGFVHHGNCVYLCFW
jgi:hypothetical protein